MPSSVLNWATPYHQLCPTNMLFPTKPKVFGCTHFVRDVRPQVSKLDLKSLKCIFFVILMVRKGTDVIVPIFDDTLCTLMLHFFKLTHFPLLLLLVRGGMMIY